MFKKLFYTFILALSPVAVIYSQPGKTEITSWQFGKKAAISLTYDDGSINQFKQALPIMNRLGLPATFFIITGQIPGSEFQGKFIGRPVEQIMKESAQTPTNESNFFERASAAAYLGYKGTYEDFTKAGAQYDAGHATEAYQIIDDLYKKVRSGAFPKVTDTGDHRTGVTWDDIRTYIKQGHEFASHTVTHPYLAALDEVNMLYELEKSKEEIQKKIGPRFTFSAECPYGTEHERVMEYALKIYPALRNRMPEPFLEEINRFSKMTPGASSKEYVQWQRGATTKTPLPLMKSWVDTVATHTNNWLVLVFHGVDGIGYEALSHELLDEYFQYIKQKEKDCWIATFADVTKYMRTKANATVKADQTKDKITVQLSHTLDMGMYNLPLTLKTYVPADWKQVKAKQGTNVVKVQQLRDSGGTFVQYQATPNAAPIELTSSR